MALVLASGVISIVPQASAGGEFPPRPRPVETDDCRRFSPPDFERLIQQLKAERAELDASWQTPSRRDAGPRPNADHEHAQLQKQLKEVLERLQQRQARPAPPAPAPLPLLEPKKKSDDAASNDKKQAPAPPDKKGEEPAIKAAPAAKGPTEPVDPLALAQALLRAEMYEDALNAFRKIDLKGKRASERAPIQYLTACCLQRMGKADEALPLLRDVTNSRGDEQLAEYAQWQIGVIRWQQETRDLLQSVRQRRQAAEKKL